jgi:hypothetical protein
MVQTLIRRVDFCLEQIGELWRDVVKHEGNVPAA